MVMGSEGDLPMTVQIRPARREDTAAMLAITRNVWHGTDYVPAVWHDWLEDARGLLQVATIDGRVVGIHHTALHADGSAWAEGIRVAEDVQGQGVGEALLASAIEWAGKRGCRYIRLSTSSENRASNRVSEKAGLRVVGRFLAMTAEASTDSEPMPDVRVAAPHDAGELWAMLTKA